MVSSFLLSAALLQSPSISSGIKPSTAESFHQANSEPLRGTATRRELSQLLLSSDPDQDKNKSQLIRLQLYSFVNELPEQISLPHQSTNDEQLRQIEIKQNLITYKAAKK